MAQKVVTKNEVTENIKIFREQVIKCFKVKNLEDLKGKHFLDQKGNLLAKGYDSININDHGAYAVINAGAEFAKSLVNKGPSNQGYYNILKSSKDPKFQAYQQLKPTEKRNPPPGVFSVANNRVGGYSSYETGKVYISLTKVLVPQDDS